MHSPYLSPAMVLDRWVRQFELEIRAALKRYRKENTFSVSGISNKARTIQTAIASQGFSVPPDAFHESWGTLDAGRRSGACPFEQFRTRAFLLSSVVPVLGTEDEVLHVTFANPNDQRESEALASFRLETRKRQLVAALRRLKKRFRRMWALGVFEISASPLADGRMTFEPHFHLMVAKVPKAALRRSLKALLPRAAPGHPLRVCGTATTAGEAALMNYFTKYDPELRKRFLLRDGRTGKGRRNLMSGPALAEWVSWFAAYRVDELLISVGLPAQLMREFRTCELQPVIEKLLRESRLHALRS